MARLLAKPIVWIIGAIAFLLLLWALYSAITAKPKAEARLARNQAEAASQSGADAVNTVGRAGDREAAGDALTRSNDKDIRDAEGADATVAAPVRDAGLASLCKRRAYSRDPRCVQYADPD